MHSYSSTINNGKVFLYYNKPPKTGSSSIQKLIVEIARINGLSCIRAPTLATSSESYDQWFKTTNFNQYDCLIGHHAMTKDRYKLLKQNTSSRNSIFITSIRNPIERSIAYFNEICSKFHSTKSCYQENPAKFLRLAFYFLKVYDGDALYRYYCSEMNCGHDWILNQFDYVINLNSNATGLAALYKKLELLGLSLDGVSIQKINVRSDDNPVNYTRYFASNDIGQEIKKEKDLYDVLLKGIK